MKKILLLLCILLGQPALAESPVVAAHKHLQALGYPVVSISHINGKKPPEAAGNHRIELAEGATEKQYADCEAELLNAEAWQPIPEPPTPEQNKSALIKSMAVDTSISAEVYDLCKRLVECDDENQRKSLYTKESASLEANTQTKIENAFSAKGVPVK